MPPILHKKLIVVGIMLLLTTIAGRQTGAATPVAPMLEMTADGRKFIKSQGKTSADIARTIPAKESIGLPIYPGAYFASHLDNVGSNGTLLAALNLVAEDSPAQIEAWYRKNLSDWSYSDTFALFYKGQGEINMGSLMEIPTITITDEADPALQGFDLMFYESQKIKSRIIIRYVPGK